MIEFEILARGVYRPDQVYITYDPSLRMPSTPAVQSWVDALWEEKLAQARAKGVPLYDSPLFRLVSVETNEAGQAPGLHILLGDTGDKEYGTTRGPEFVRWR